MKDTDWVWGAAAVVIFIGIYTHTPYIQNFIRKVKNQGFRYGYAPTFDYRNTESVPRVTQDQLEELYPENGVVRPHPNQHLCTGECKSGTCDSQGFCIDSGCGSVIRGGSQCHKKKHKTTEKAHKNTTPHIHIFPFPTIEIPALNPDYRPPAQSSDQNLTSPSTTPTDVADNPFGDISGDQQIQPTVPTTSPTPTAPPQHVYLPPPPPSSNTIHPTPAPPKKTPTTGTPIPYATLSPSTWKPGSAQNYGCSSSEHNLGNSCRQGTKVPPPPGHRFYNVNANFRHTGSGGRGTNNPSIEITAGGPGSTTGDCCGVTTKLEYTGHGGHGPPEFIIEKEDWYGGGAGPPKGKHDPVCNGYSCIGGNIDPPTSLEGPIDFSWHAERMQDGRYMYCGKLNDTSSGCIGRPNVLGMAIVDVVPGRPSHWAQQGVFAEDSTRCRGDGLGTTICTGNATYQD